jgi:hypothetical protein
MRLSLLRPNVRFVANALCVWMFVGDISVARADVIAFANAQRPRSTKGPIPAPTSNAPTPQQLARMAGEAYKPKVTSVDTFTVLNVNESGFGASRSVIFANADRAQIVMAVRGTETNRGSGVAVDNIVSDASFTTGNPSTHLRNDIVAHASVLSTVMSQNPDATITLTGHSLGGAEAALLAFASGKRAVTANAPGPAELYPALTSELSAVKGSVPGEVTNYRVDYDQVSLVGTHIGDVLTLPAPAGVFPPRAVEPWDIPTWMQNAASALGMHKIDVLIKQIDQAPAIPIGPSASSIINSQQSPQDISKDQSAIDSLLEFDVSGAWDGPEDVVLIRNSDSGLTEWMVRGAPDGPQIGSLWTAAAHGIDTYAIRALVGGLWLEYFVEPGQPVFFGSPVTELEVMPLDQDGGIAALPGGLPFGLGFDSSGQFVADYERVVPEPPAWTLFLISTLYLAVTWRHIAGPFKRPRIEHVSSPCPVREASA